MTNYQLPKIKLLVIRHWKLEIFILGDRLAVGHQILDLSTGVRIPVPQLLRFFLRLLADRKIKHPERSEGYLIKTYVFRLHT